VKLRAVEVSGLAPQAQAAALADPGWALIRLTATPGATSSTATLIGLPFPDGEHPLTTIDLDTGKPTKSTLKVTGGKATVPLGKDAVLIVKT